MAKFKALKDFVLLSGGEAISKVIGFVAFAYLARVVSPEAYGAIELAAAMLIFFSLLVDLGYGPIGAREISQDEDLTQEYVALISSARFILALVAVPLMCVAALFMNLSDSAIKLVWIFSLALLAAPWNQRWLFQGMDKMQWVSIGQLIRMLVFLFGIMWLISSTDDLMIVGYVEVAASFAMAIFFAIMQLRENIHLKLNFHLKKLLNLTNEAFSFGLSQSIWAFNQYLPTFLIASFVSAVDLAWYGASHRIVISLVTFSMVYHFNLFPALSKRLKHSLDAFYGLIIPSFKVTLWGGILIALGLTLLAEPIIILIYGEKFKMAALPLAITIWALPFTLLNGHGRWALVAAHQQRYVLYTQMSGTVAAVTSGLVLVPIYGATGGGITMVVTSFTVWVAANYHAKRLVAPIPFILKALPAFLLALAMIVLVYYLLPYNIFTAIGGIAGFIILAPLIDRQLINDLKRFMHVKDIPLD